MHGALGLSVLIISHCSVEVFAQGLPATIDLMPRVRCIYDCAAEANIFGDPHAADYVFSQPLPLFLVPLDVTTRCQLSGSELAGMRGCGAFGSFLCSITQFYLEYHRCCPASACQAAALQ